MNGNEINPFSSIVNSVFSKMGTSREGDVRLLDAWSRILMRIKSPVNENEGSNMAEHSRVVDLKKGILFVEVDHPGWMELIQLHRNYIMRGLSIECPDVEITNLAFNLKGNRDDVGKNFDYGKNFAEEKKRFNEKLEAEEKVISSSTPQMGGNTVESGKKTVEMAPELEKLMEKLKNDMLTNSNE